MDLPQNLLKNLRDVHEDAERWLMGLPALLSDLERLWAIRVMGLVPELSYNVLLFAEGEDGTPYVLKLSPPSEDFEREAAALRHYDGDGVCRLVHADENAAAMLLERVTTGISLWTTDPSDPQEDEAATRTAATLMQRLWRPVPALHPFRTLASWSRGIPSHLETPEAGALPLGLVGRANALRLELLQNPEAVLLHADLHHGNILSASRHPYLAIDPKGIVGPRGYEIGPFLENPTPSLAREVGLRSILKRRIAIFSEMLELEAREVAAWSFVHAVLSACWSAEDHGTGWEGAVAVAEALGERL